MVLNIYTFFYILLFFRYVVQEIDGELMYAFLEAY